jgi:hypothetical protein
LLLGVRAVHAQSADPYFATFSANYDVIYHETGDTSNAGAHFDVATTVKRDIPFVSALGEVGFNHFPGATVASVMGGARLRIPLEDDRFLPFGQFLVGLYHCGACSLNDFALQAGGGVDFRMRRRNFRLRAQVDFRHVFDTFADFNAVRLSGGIVFPLNRR